MPLDRYIGNCIEFYPPNKKGELISGRVFSIKNNKLLVFSLSLNEILEVEEERVVSWKVKR